jgi:hypothetical protein
LSAVAVTATITAEAEDRGRADRAPRDESWRYRDARRREPDTPRGYIAIDPTIHPGGISRREMPG